jgi:hypothetical protein
MSAYDTFQAPGGIDVRRLLAMIKPDVMGWINQAELDASGLNISFDLPDNVGSRPSKSASGFQLIVMLSTTRGQDYSQPIMRTHRAMIHLVLLLAFGQLAYWHREMQMTLPTSWVFWRMPIFMARVQPII